MTDPDEGMPAQDKRSEKRVNGKDLFLIEVKQQGKTGNLNKGYSCDLSLHSVRFTAIGSFPVGTKLAMILHLTPKFTGVEKIELNGEVIRVQTSKGKIYRQIVCKFLFENIQAQEALRTFFLWALGLIQQEGMASALVYESHQEGKREHRRVSAHDEFMVEFRQGMTPYKGYGCDLSQTGGRFITSVNLERGSQIQMDIYFVPAFPGPRKITVDARVVRCLLPPGRAYYQVGCTFEDPRGEAKRVVQQFLDWLETRGMGIS